MGAPTKARVRSQPPGWAWGPPVSAGVLSAEGGGHSRRGRFTATKCPSAVQKKASAALLVPPTVPAAASDVSSRPPPPIQLFGSSRRRAVPPSASGPQL